MAHEDHFFDHGRTGTSYEVFVFIYGKMNKSEKISEEARTEEISHRLCFQKGLSEQQKALQNQGV